MIFGYAVGSKGDQDFHTQLDELGKYGCEIVFKEIPTTNKENPELKKLFGMLRPGDTVVICKLKYICKSSIKHLYQLSKNLEKNHVQIVSIQDNIDTSKATNSGFFSIMASIEKLEKDIISENTKLGLAAAMINGKRGGRPKENEKKLKEAKELYDSKDYSISKIVKLTGISQSTLYRYIKGLQ